MSEKKQKQFMREWGLRLIRKIKEKKASRQAAREVEKDSNAIKFCPHCGSSEECTS